MAALTVIKVAGFTGVEISCGITIDLAVDIAVLQVGDRVAFLAAIVIGGRKIVNADRREQESERLPHLCHTLR